MKRVANLYRVSTKKQVDLVKDDIPMQRIACREFAERQGWTVVIEKEEKGISGFKVSASKRDAILQNCEEESIIENLSHVKEELEENPKALIDFSEEIFRAIIEKIIVEEDGTVSYRLKGGIKLTEDITEVI